MNNTKLPLNKRKAYLLGLFLLIFFSISYLNPSKTFAVGTCSHNGYIIGVEWVADKCASIGPPYNYMYSAVRCEGGTVIEYENTNYYDYTNRTPAQMESSAKMWAGSGRVFRNTEGTRFLVVVSQYTGALEGVGVTQYAPVPSVHYDVFDNYYFPPATVPDNDGDGYYVCVDCDEANPAINPAASEDCTDEADNNCDGNTDCLDGACLADPACFSPLTCEEKGQQQILDCPTGTGYYECPEGDVYGDPFVTCDTCDFEQDNDHDGFNQCADCDDSNATLTIQCVSRDKPSMQQGSNCP